MALLQAYSTSARQNKPRRIIFRFLTSPLEIKGDGRVQSVVLGRNEIIQNEDGSLSARATGETEEIACGLIFRSVGYRGVALPGIPFDARTGIIPNREGRVLHLMDGTPMAGLYVVGWIKRGPSGIIGTNKPDSVATVEHLLEDMRGGALWSPDSSGIETVLKAKGAKVVDFAAWLRIDAQEIERGAKIGRPRVKFTSVGEMLAALDNT